MIDAIKGLFSSAKLVDNVSSGLDKIVFTGEEKADNFALLMQLYVPFKTAQRALAVIFCVPYAAAFFITFICSFFVDVSAQIELLAGDIAMIVGVGVAFYFGGGFVEGIIGQKTEANKRAQTND
jgi:uncharacterized membrane protein YjdF